MPIVLAGATSGSATIQATDAQTVTITMPATSGTLSVGGTTPSYSTLTVTGNTYLATSSGSVGIGTSSPGTILDVSQSLNGASTIRLTNSNAGASASAGLSVANSGSSGQFTIAGASYGGYGAWTANDTMAYASTNLVLMADSGSGVIKFSTGGNGEKMRITSSGNLLIGSTTNYGPKIYAASGGAVSPATSGNMTTGYLFATGDGSQGLNFGQDSNGTWYNSAYVNNAGVALNHRWYVGGIEAMRIDTSGRVLIGVTSDPAGFGGKLSISGGGHTGYMETTATSGYACLTLKRAGATSGDQMYFYTTTGLAGIISSSGTSTSYGTSSDYRLKEDVQPMSGALAKIAQLKPVTYKWKADGSNGQGFIAHELQSVVPDCVTGEKDAVNEDGSIKPQGIDTSFLVATLTAAIQELNAKVTALEAQLGVK